MAEISKNMKIVIIINVIAAFIYGFMYLVIPEIIATLNDSPHFDPHMWRIFGGTAIALGIFAVIMIMRAEWESSKIFWEFAIVWLIIVLIINLIMTISVPRSAVNLASQWFDNVVVIVLIIVDIYFYLQEGK
ncbi:MAG: hypothetical protein ACFE8A_02410 [Candidatus Hodarchaeota archaeon]